MNTLDLHVADLRATPTMDRRTLVRTLVRLLATVNVRWAFQGTADAAAEWCERHDAKDLDLWVASADVHRAEAALDALGGVQVARSDDPRRLRHQSWWIDVDGRAAIVDLTVGDLAVGPITLCPEVDVRTRLTDDDRLGVIPVLGGIAAAVDLAVRPALRGKVAADPRITEARLAWWLADVADRNRCLQRLYRQIGRPGLALAHVLSGEAMTRELATDARRALARRTLRPASLRAAWGQRWAIASPRRGVGPAGIRSSGTLVVLVGTDGSGKSTVATELTRRLERAGFDVSSAYFGMARGNLPGVALARRILGVAPEATPNAGEEVAQTQSPAVMTDDADLAHPMLRRVAAWYYAVEYGWRYATSVAPALRRGEIVVCDRYVYDLRTSPWPNSRAAGFAQRLAGRPHVLAMADAPAEAIFARKPERAVESIRSQQAGFRSLLAERPAACAEIIVDTSGETADPTLPLYQATIAAAHRRTAPPR